MFHKTLLTLISGATALVLLSVQPAIAQDGTGDDRSGMTGQSREAARGEDEPRGGRQNRRGAAAAPTSEDNKAAAQAFLTAAAVDCRVSEATLLGVTAEQHSTYEAICAEGPGYLVVGSTPPQTFNCLELAGQAETSRLRDPTADVGQQCTLPVNLDPLPVLTTYARQAGIDCTVDQAAAIGKNNAGKLIFEIGCADRGGYWIEKADDSWKTSPCWALSLQGASCRYSTEAETLGGWSTVLAGTEAASCDVQQARRVGRDAQGLTVYEVKCGAGDGYFARVGDTYTAQRVQACATPEAAAVAGGCTLTTAATAPAPTGQ
ncbi:MAG: hypothetical protein SWI22_10380 [Pseudomonadota bacterium]|nr:hypothetical protein [Pseudomonadota bacterium]